MNVAFIRTVDLVGGLVLIAVVVQRGRGRLAAGRRSHCRCRALGRRTNHGGALDRASCPAQSTGEEPVTRWTLLQLRGYRHSLWAWWWIRGGGACGETTAGESSTTTVMFWWYRRCFLVESNRSLVFRNTEDRRTTTPQSTLRYRRTTPDRRHTPPGHQPTTHIASVPPDPFQASFPSSPPHSSPSRQRIDSAATWAPHCANSAGNSNFNTPTQLWYAPSHPVGPLPAPALYPSLLQPAPESMSMLQRLEAQCRLMSLLMEMAAQSAMQLHQLLPSLLLPLAPVIPTSPLSPPPRAASRRLLVEPKSLLLPWPAGLPPLQPTQELAPIHPHTQAPFVPTTVSAPAPLVSQYPTLKKGTDAENTRPERLVGLNTVPEPSSTSPSNNSHFDSHTIEPLQGAVSLFSQSPSLTTAPTSISHSAASALAVSSPPHCRLFQLLLHLLPLHRPFLPLLPLRT